MIKTYKTPKDVPKHLVHLKKAYSLYDLVPAKNFTDRRFQLLTKLRTTHGLSPTLRPVIISQTVENQWVAVYVHQSDDKHYRR
jgi:hypothetical protein